MAPVVAPFGVWRVGRRRFLYTALAGGGCLFRPLSLTAQTATQASSTATPAALELARLVASIRYESLSEAARKHARMIVASTFASASLGTKIDSARIVRELAKDAGGKPEATIWFDGTKLPVAAAARVNAMLSDSAAFDDSDLRNVAHTGTCITAVGLALAERSGASGKDLLTALVAGYEAAGRIGEALAASTSVAGGIGAIGGAVGRGLHASATVAFGGAATASRLLGLTPEQTAHVFGIVATTVGGLSIGTNSFAREYHAGNAALTAVNAALAASRGFTVNRDMLEASGGFLSVFGGGKIDTSALGRPVGKDGYQIERYLAIKLSAGAHALHPAAEAAANASREANTDPSNIAKILVAGPQSALASAPAPKDPIEMIHSLRYYLAAAVVSKRFSLNQASTDALDNPGIRRLIPLVEADPSPSSIKYQWNWGATVTLVTTSGRRFTSTVDAPKGSAPRGIAWDDVDAKFRTSVQTLLPGPRAGDLLQSIHNLDALPNIAAVAALAAA